MATHRTLPKQVSRALFNTYIRPHLSKAKRGPKGKCSLYKIFNYILYVLHSGIQWSNLRTRKNELYYTNVYKWHNRWSKDGSYTELFDHSVDILNRTYKLDISLLHGDGSVTTAKKGVNQ
jgi:transposase